MKEKKKEKKKNYLKKKKNGVNAAIVVTINDDHCFWHIHNRPRTFKLSPVKI